MAGDDSWLPGTLIVESDVVRLRVGSDEVGAWLLVGGSITRLTNRIFRMEVEGEILELRAADPDRLAHRLGLAFAADLRTKVRLAGSTAGGISQASRAEPSSPDSLRKPRQLGGLLVGGGLLIIVGYFMPWVTAGHATSIVTVYCERDPSHRLGPPRDQPDLVVRLRGNRSSRRMAV